MKFSHDEILNKKLFHSSVVLILCAISLFLLISLFSIVCNGEIIDTKISHFKFYFITQNNSIEVSFIIYFLYIGLWIISIPTFIFAGIGFFYISIFYIGDYLLNMFK
jgi:hypothetical protein